MDYTERGYYESALLMAQNLNPQHNTPKEIQQAYNHLLTKRALDRYGIELKAQLKRLGAKEKKTPKVHAVDKRSQRSRRTGAPCHSEFGSGDPTSLWGLSSVNNAPTNCQSIMMASMDI